MQSDFREIFFFFWCFPFPGWKETFHPAEGREGSLLHPHSKVELWTGHQSSVQMCSSARCQLCQFSGPGESLPAEQHTCCGLTFGFLSAAEAEILILCLFAALQRAHAY